MALMRLYDGTRNRWAGSMLKTALSELAKQMEVCITPAPGSYDLRSFNFIQSISARATDRRTRQRRQVNKEKLEHLLRCTKGVDSHPGRQNIVLIERDLYSEGLNWCFGGYHRYMDRDFVVVSTARISDDIHLFHILAHELGHMYGAAYPGRSNTTESLGSHCINSNCVMQQRLTLEESLAYAHRRIASGAPTYCRQCQTDLRSNR